jgi:hypothetical protein
VLSPEFIELHSGFVSIYNFETGSHAPDDAEYEHEFNTFNIVLLEDNFKKFANVDDLTDKHSWYDVLEVLEAVIVGIGNVEVELLLQLVFAILVISRASNPSLDISLPLVTIIIGDVQDTSTRHSSGSGVVQVSDLENEFHVRLKSNTLVGGKGEELVIVHDRVHGLNPISIQISIENDPFPVGVCFLREVTEFA